MDQNIQAKLNERLKIFDDVVSLKKPERVPTLDTSTSWKIFQSKLDPKPTVVEAVCEPSIAEKVLREHIENYHFDAISGASITNGLFAKVVGMENMLTQVYDDDRMIQALSTNFMEKDELEEFGQDLTMYTWTKVFPRRFKNLTYGQIKQLVKYTLEGWENHKHLNEMTLIEFGIPNMLGGGWVMSVTEYLFEAYQGIDGFAKTMRRNSGQLTDLCEKFDKDSIAQLDLMLSLSNDNCIFDVSSTLLAHSIMSSKQFEKFYWPLLKKTLDKVVAANKKMYIFVESDLLRFAEFFRDVPSGHLALTVEMDDIFEVRKALPNVCLIGGMPVDLLAKGSTQECVDRAKHLCDTLGGTGFVLAPNKLLAYPNDAKPENMKAVQEFVLNYKL